MVSNYEQIPSKYSHEMKQLIRMCLTVDDQMRFFVSQLLETTVLSGIDANMEKFDSKEIIDLIDRIKCPRVLRFLNTKLPNLQRKVIKRKNRTLLLRQSKQKKTQGNGFNKISKPQNLSRIRSQKVMALVQDQPSSGPSILTKVTSKKNIKLPPLQNKKALQKAHQTSRKRSQKPTLQQNPSNASSSQSTQTSTPLRTFHTHLFKKIIT